MRIFMMLKFTQSLRPTTCISRGCNITFINFIFLKADKVLLIANIVVKLDSQDGFK